MLADYAHNTEVAESSLSRRNFCVLSIRTPTNRTVLTSTGTCREMKLDEFLARGYISDEIQKEKNLIYLLMNDLTR